MLHAIAGAGAGCASLALTYPLYARMVRQQVDSSHKQATDAVISAPCCSSTPSLSDALTSLRSLFTARGLAPHFAGLSAALWAITVQSGIYYFAFQFFKNLHGVTTSPLGNILTGSEAGVATVLLTNPLWVINSRQITKKKPVAATSAVTTVATPAAAAAATSSDVPQMVAPIPAIAASPSSSGSSALHRTRISRAASNEALGLLTVPAVDTADGTRSPSPALPASERNFLPSPAASAAASASSSVSTAATTAAPAAASQSLSDVSFLTAFRLLVAQEGLAGVYSGVGPALALVSSPAIQFASYEWMRAILLRARVRAAVMAVGGPGSLGASGASASVFLTSADYFLLGALSKILATVVTYPIQTLKSQLQQDGSPYSSLGAFAAVVKCVRDMVGSEEGFSSFYRGLKAKILQTGLTSAFLFVFRERIIEMLTRITATQAVTKAVVG